MFTYASEISKAPNGRFDEKCWNETATLGDSAYQLSKTLAEKAAWEIVESQDRFDMCTVHPSFVMGPTLSGREDAESVKFMKKIMTGEQAMGAPKMEVGIVDVRDVAMIHYKAMITPGAKGRYIASNEHSSPFIEFGRALKETYPTMKLPQKELPNFLLYIVLPLAAGISWKYIRNSVGYSFSFDISKTQDELGMTFRHPHDSMKDMAASLIERGIVEDVWTKQ